MREFFFLSLSLEIHDIYNNNKKKKKKVGEKLIDRQLL